MLLVLVMFAFPPQRIANLPTGHLVESGHWQLCLSHRFFSPVNYYALRGNLFNFLTRPTVRVTADRGHRNWSIGVAAGNAGHELALRAGYAPGEFATLYGEVSANVVSLRTEDVWTSVLTAVPWTPSPVLHLVAAPQVAVSMESLFASLGLGVVANAGQDLCLGLELEPVLLGKADKLAWNLALDKKLGWHNFTLVLGNSYYQQSPYRFSRANRDITKGFFRIGFNILRKF